MIALQMADIKDFMNKFLCSGLFDHFLVKEAAITTFVTHEIDGHVRPDFFDSSEIPPDLLKQVFVPFSMLRPVCFQLMKGTKPPLSFKFVFLLSPENLQRTLSQAHSSFRPEDITGMYLHLKYQNKKLICTTGISYGIFSMDKSLEQEWDRLIIIFFKNNKIPYEIL